MSQENVELLNAWIEAFNGRDHDRLEQLHHPSIEWQTTAEDPDAAIHRGQGAVRRYIDGYLDAFPDLRIEGTECFPIGTDRVFATNHFSGHSATGVSMDWLLTTVTTYEQGRVVRVIEYFDRAAAREAAGLRE